MKKQSANILVNAYLNGKSLTKIFDDSVVSRDAARSVNCGLREKSASHRNIWRRGRRVTEFISSETLFAVPKMSGALAMCCSLEGDFHELPTYLAQISIENEGWEVVNFGANTPLYSLADEVSQYLPALVCISVTILSDLERLSRDYKIFTEQIAKHKIPVVMGGAVFRR
ncbi:MAG: hypothetical protein WKF71_10045 [Pyrinomonadaceae bacterium]